MNYGANIGGLLVLALGVFILILGIRGNQKELAPALFGEAPPPGGESTGDVKLGFPL